MEATSASLAMIKLAYSVSIISDLEHRNGFNSGSAGHT
jgi:hypothetical protein